MTFLESWRLPVWRHHLAWTAVALVASLLPQASEAQHLQLSGIDSFFFSDLDGSSSDGDGVVNGVLTLSNLSISDDAEIVIDVPTALFDVAGQVEVTHAARIRADGNVATEIEIQAGRRIRLTGTSSISSAGVSGGRIRLCSGGDIELSESASVSAGDLDASFPGGSVLVEAAGRLAIEGASAAVRAIGTTGGTVTLVSCGGRGPGSSTSISKADLLLLGRVEAVGTAGFGGTVSLEARQGDVLFGPGFAGIDAGGSSGSGTVSITAAGFVTPSAPPSTPAAEVFSSSPSEEACRCTSGPPIPKLVVFAEVDRPTGLTGNLITFSGRIVEPESPVVQWQWELSDGQSLSGQTISTSFLEAGFYSARLTATDTEGTMVTSETGVTIFPTNSQAPPILGLPDLMGDVNNDGVITLEDAHLIAKQAGGLELLPSDRRRAADIDLDGLVDPADGLLAGRAVAASKSLPSVITPAVGPPGSRVNLISSELLDPNSIIELQVGESAWIQTPLRVALGYATFMVPLDASVGNSIQVQPGPIEVRILSNGSLIETLSFEIEAPDSEPADPLADLSDFLDGYGDLFALQRDALNGLIDYAGVDGDERELLLAAFTGAEQDTRARILELQALLEAPGGTGLARAFFLFANANGYQDHQQKVDRFFRTNRALVAEFLRNPSGATPDEVLEIVCAVKEASDLLSTGGDILSFACDALLAAAVVAAVIPADGPVVDAALLYLWASQCGVVEVTVELGLLINEIVGSIEPDLRFAVSLSSPGPGESTELRAELEVVGLDDVCEFGISQVRDEFIEELAEEAIERLLRKKIALRALAGVVELLSEELLEVLEDRLEKLVVRVVNHTHIGDALEELSGRVCDVFQLGPPLLIDLSQALQGPTPDVGDLTFNSDGTASYICPSTGTTSASSVEFSTSRELCGETVERIVTVNCETRPVTITMGDNGSLNDDIFEVRIMGQTVLTSSTPVRAISTTVQLAVGDHAIQMIGRAAPDGVGTYYITFSGATVIGGDATSGSDLTPGVVKTFIIRVQ